MGSETGLGVVRGGGIVAADAALLDRAQELATASRADATLSAYDRDWRHFTAWAAAHDLTPLPAESATVAMYAADLTDSYKPSTIARRMAAISVAHQHAGHSSPTRDASVRSVLAGIRRTSGTAPAQVAPATIGDIRRMVSRLGEDTIDVRDRALLLVGFAGAFRRSELVALDVADLVDNDDGLVIAVRRSKRDQEGRGDTKAIPYGTDHETCPVRAVKAWMEHAGITEGPVFRSVDRHGNVSTAALSGRAVADIVKRAAERAGLDPQRYSGHSLRAGFVTTAAANGATERAIARQTGHAPNSTVLRTYIRHASAFTDNAVSTIGL